MWHHSAGISLISGPELLIALAGSLAFTTRLTLSPACMMRLVLLVFPACLTLAMHPTFTVCPAFAVFLAFTAHPAFAACLAFTACPAFTVHLAFAPGFLTLAPSSFLLFLTLLDS